MAQLIDASSGTHLWADRFEGGLEDIFELQDRAQRASEWLDYRGDRRSTRSSFSHVLLRA
jgi:hypothetical protein